MCDIIWRLGPGVEAVAASQGHWVGASYIYGAGDWSTCRSAVGTSDRWYGTCLYVKP